MVIKKYFEMKSNYVLLAKRIEKADAIILEMKDLKSTYKMLLVLCEGAKVLWGADEAVDAAGHLGVRAFGWKIHVGTVDFWKY